MHNTQCKISVHGSECAIFILTYLKRFPRAIPERPPRFTPATISRRQLYGSFVRIGHFFLGKPFRGKLRQTLDSHKNIFYLIPCRFVYYACLRQPEYPLKCPHRFNCAFAVYSVGRDDFIDGGIVLITSAILLMRYSTTML